MAYVSRDSQGNINGVFANPQPDALDDDGNVVCAGVVTEELPDDDPAVLAYRNRELP